MAVAVELVQIFYSLNFLKLFFNDLSNRTHFWSVQFLKKISFLKFNKWTCKKYPREQNDILFVKISYREFKKKSENVR